MIEPLRDEAKVSAFAYSSLTEQSGIPSRQDLFLFRLLGDVYTENNRNVQTHKSDIFLRHKTNYNPNKQ